MDLRRFITLKTVVEEGSFLRASQKLCCTQSTVTFHIQQLEQEFSVQLFEKIGRRMCLTREGKKLLPHIYELTRVMDTLREAAKKESDPDGELRVVSGETLLSYRMPQVLQRFRQRAPKVRLSLQSRCWWLHRKLQMSILLSREDITPVALLSTNRNVSSGRYLRARCVSGGSRWKTPLSL